MPSKKKSKVNKLGSIYSPGPNVALDFKREVLDKKEHQNKIVEAKALYDAPDSDPLDQWYYANAKKTCDAVRSGCGLEEASSTYVPFGGADDFYPAMLTGSRVTYLTGAEAWGRLADVEKPFDPHLLLGTVQGRNFDPEQAWKQSEEKFGFAPNTLGPLGVHRRIDAEELKGNKVTSLRFANFKFIETEKVDGNGQKIVALDYTTPDKHTVYDNMAYLTTAGGQEKVTFYLRDQILRGPLAPKGAAKSQPAQIDLLQRFIEQTTPENGLVVVQKGIPGELLSADQEIKKRLAPKTSLVGAVICDDAERHQVYIDNLKGHEIVDLSNYGTDFGRGPRLHMHTPEPMGKPLDMSHIKRTNNDLTPAEQRQLLDVTREKKQLRPFGPSRAQLSAAMGSR